MKNALFLTLFCSFVFANESPIEMKMEVPIEEIAGESIESFFAIEEQNPDVSSQTAAQEEMVQEMPLEEPPFPLINDEIEPPSAVILDLSYPKPMENSSAAKILDLSPGPVALEKKEDFLNNIEQDELAVLEKEVNGPEKNSQNIVIDFVQVFSGSPTIYTVLIAMSIGSFCIWLYILGSIKTSQIIPKKNIEALRHKLSSSEYEEAVDLCEKSHSILFKMLSAGIVSRRSGQVAMLEAMKAEGKRASANYWQKLSLLNDIAIIAPMLGLLGTVLGMFYAFYDLNRSMESISTLFDGLGVSVGTTICGLIVAIIAMAFHAIARYKLIRQLTLLENKAQKMSHLIETKE